MPRALPAAAALALALVLGLIGSSSILAASLPPSAPPDPTPQVTGPLEGIDVSNWQGTIDWAQVAAAGKSFAIAKATEGETYRDPYWPTNHANARANGLRVTAYHFAQPGNPASEANIQADWFLQNAALMAGDIIPALDLEVTNGLSVSDLQAWVGTWLNRVYTRTGAKPMIYASPNFWRTYMGDTRMFADQGYSILWIAHWGVSNPTVPASNWGGNGWTFWQYTSSGTVPGIGGRVDLDRYNGTDLTPVLFGPGVPTGVSGAPGDRQVAVSWTTPASSSGGAISGYTVTAAPGGATCATSGATACTVTGLANGTPYTFTVRASNASGTGVGSAPSASVTPRTVPAAPTGVTATPGNGSVAVGWSAPASNGGTPITGYTVTASPGGAICTTSGALSCTVGGLTNGTAYTFAVSAANAAGSGPAGKSASVTPRTVPGAPTSVVGAPADGFVQVSWGAPASNGGAAISAYTVTASPGGAKCTTSGALTCAVVGLTNGTPYSFTVAASNVAGTGPASSASATVSPWPPVSSTYHPMAPVRILDSRVGTGLSGVFRSGVGRTLKVTGVAGIPSNATAVTGNVTVTGQTAPGWVTVAPSVAGAAGVSTINVPLGEDLANAMTAPLSSGGTVVVMYTSPGSSGTAHVIFDATGYFVPDLNGATFVPLAPARLVDTRVGTGLSGSLVADVPRTFQVTGRGGVPGGAIAITGTVTVTGQTARGWITMGPTVGSATTFSTLNFRPGEDRANNVQLALGSGGKLVVVLDGAPTGASADLVFDVTGYFVADRSGAAYVPLSPTRLLDTRVGNGLSGSFSSGVPRSFQVSARGGVPTTAVAVTGNLTVTAQTAPGVVFLGPTATSVPSSSTLNFPFSGDRANGTAVALGSGGTLSGVYFVAPSGRSTGLIFDVTGYYVGP